MSRDDLMAMTPLNSVVVCVDCGTPMLDATHPNLLARGFLVLHHGTPADRRLLRWRLLYSPDQPRDEQGRWTDGGGGGGSRGEPGYYDTSAGLTLDESIQEDIDYERMVEGLDHPGPVDVFTSDVDAAAKALAQGKQVRLSQPREVSTLLDKLAGIVKEAEARGERAPMFNLCNVSVAGTNLFCAENKGYARIKMPQLSGKPLSGSHADRMPKNPKGEVDLGPSFRDYLEARGVAVDDQVERADFLRASQNELNGAKVAGMYQALKAGTMKPAPIFVTADNYVIDGHHRWAANVAYDLIDNHQGDVQMPVERVNMDIITALHEANAFTRAMGIPQAHA